MTGSVKWAQKPKRKKHAVNPKRALAASVAHHDRGQETEEDTLTKGAQKRKRQSDHEKRPDKS